MPIKPLKLTALVIIMLVAIPGFFRIDASQSVLSAPVYTFAPDSRIAAQSGSPTPGVATPTPIFTLPQSNMDACGIDCNPSEFLDETDLFLETFVNSEEQSIFQLSRNLVPAPTPVAIINARASSVPLYQQKQSLTCEEASVAMATRGKITEDQLLAILPRNENPFVGIRGSTNSAYSGSLNDYGVYAPPLQTALNKLGINNEASYRQPFANFKNWVVNHLRAGHPIVWWHTWKDKYQTPVMVKLSDGTSVKLVPYEHASVIVAASDKGITYHDPYDAKIRLVSWAAFQRSSGYFDNMAIVIY